MGLVAIAARDRARSATQPLVSGLWEVTKPRVVLLLTLEGIAGALIAAGRAWPERLPALVVAAVIVWLASAGAEAITNVIDRDIDARMSRTRTRVLVTARLLPTTALAWGGLLTLTALCVALRSDIWTFVWVLGGLVDNIVVYSLLAKRRTPWSPVLGAFSGAAPALIGYSVVAGRVAGPGFAFALLVMVWTPVHVWSLAWRHREDYRQAEIPMPPVVWNGTVAAGCIEGATVLLLLVSLWACLGVSGPVGLAAASFITAGLALTALRFWLRRDASSAWVLFQSANLYLLLMMAILVAGRVG